MYWWLEKYLKIWYGKKAISKRASGVTQHVFYNYDGQINDHENENMIETEIVKMQEL